MQQPLYRMFTIESDRQDNRYEISRGMSESLSCLARKATEREWLPGNVSGTGLTIIETVIESV